MALFRKPSHPEAAQSPWLARLARGLSATRSKLGQRLESVLSRSPSMDRQTLDELETILLAADVGVAATKQLLGSLEQRYRDRTGSEQSADALLRTIFRELLAPLERPFVLGEARPNVIMFVGVNGAGKTTTIGKFTKLMRDQGRSVLLAAGDTFRAAAADQLRAWAQRNDIAVIGQAGADAAAVVFDAVAAATARQVDVVLADTAGRLATQSHLMDELRKIRRVIGKAQPGAPHEIFLVLDANTGQNALSQVRAFDAALQLTGLILTKLDGSARGGTLAAIAKEHPIALRYLGMGEGIDDLQPFAAADFVDALFAE